MTPLNTTHIALLERLAYLNDVPVTAYLPVFTESDVPSDH